MADIARYHRIHEIIGQDFPGIGHLLPAGKARLVVTGITVKVLPIGDLPVCRPEKPPAQRSRFATFPDDSNSVRLLQGLPDPFHDFPTGFRIIAGIFADIHIEGILQVGQAFFVHLGDE
jgi:hypothetical protein